MSSSTVRHPSAVRNAKRALAALATAVLALAWLVGAPSVERAGAASFLVTSEAELRAALTVAATNDADDVITLAADFTWSGAISADAVTDDYDLEIDGAGHTITGSGTVGVLFDYDGTTAGSFSLHDVTLDGLDAVHIADVVSATTISLDNVTVTNSGGDGSPFQLDGDTVTIGDSTFTGNTADDDFGGAINVTAGTLLEVTGSTFTENYSFDGGGAIYVVGDVDILDSTFSENYTDESSTRGGAVRASGAVTVTGGTFTGNYTNYAGGAIYSFGGIEVNGALFEENHAGYSGGAIGVTGTATIGNIEGATFKGNYASVHGGAVNATNDTDIWDSTFDGNDAQGGDGGAVNSAKIVTATDSVFTDNSAPSGITGGGAILGFFGVTATNSTFTDNTARTGGAIGSWYPVTVESSTFSNNSATADGGVIRTTSASGTVNIVNSTFVENTSDSDGGVVWASAAVSVMHSTFIGNSDAGDADIVGTSAGILTSEASVFYTAGSPGLCDAAGGVSSSGYNSDYDGTCSDDWDYGTDFGSGADPMVGALADNGGPTLTALPDATSPLIDAIAGADCSLGTDQRGVTRPEPGGTSCDIGAVEVIADTEFDIVTASGTIHVTATNLTCVNSSAAIDEADLSPEPPSTLVLPFGGFTFDVCVPDDGWSTTVTLDLPSPVHALWKLTDSTWSKVPGVIISGNTVTYVVTDGGPLDDDGSADGVIVDPAAPAIVLSFTG